MKTNISQSQAEVWEWKERAFRKLDKVPEKERVKYIYNKTKGIIDKIKKKKESKV